VSINLLGWVGITVVGTLVTLWPTMLRTQVAPTAERAARRALPILAVSVLALAGGALLGSRPIAVVAVAGYLAGLCIIGAPRVVEARRRPPTTFATLSVLAAAAWFVGCIVALGAILVTAPDWEEAAETADRLGLPLLLGFAAQLLVGALSLVPVVSWWAEHGESDQHHPEQAHGVASGPAQCGSRRGAHPGVRSRAPGQRGGRRPRTRQFPAPGDRRRRDLTALHP
jgi:hypothetical protein